jgi:hypothetical protein
VARDRLSAQKPGVTSATTSTVWYHCQCYDAAHDINARPTETWQQHTLIAQEAAEPGAVNVAIIIVVRRRAGA